MKATITAEIDRLRVGIHYDHEEAGGWRHGMIGRLEALRERAGERGPWVICGHNGVVGRIVVNSRGRTIGRDYHRYAQCALERVTRMGLSDEAIERK